MTNHEAFRLIDIELKGHSQNYMRTSLYSQRLSEIYNMRFSHACDLIYLTEGGRKIFFKEKRTVYLPFIINNVEVLIRALKWN